jgi:ABC-type antimicrobial peptide transport system permease subunit
VRAAITQIDPGVAASGIRSLEDVWLSSLGPRRTNVRILEAFGYAAIVLCAIGVYGVAALAARTRRRELAIRLALGAGRAELTRSLLRQEVPPVLAGLVAGLTAAGLAAPYLFADAFQTSPRDLRTYAEVVGLLLGVAAAALFTPLRRAATTSPSEVLKA